MREHKKRAKAESSPDDTVEAHGDTQTADSAVVDDTDALLDEIDGVLEENAEEFVKGYVQKGGE